MLNMDAPQKNYELSSFESFALGGAAAIIGKIVTAPMERVKILLQCQHEIIKSGRITEPYKGVIDCAMKTFRNEGVLPFWRGNLASLIGFFPMQALNFAFKDQIKMLFKMHNADLYWTNFYKNIMSGGVAGAMSLCFVYSLDYARTRLANDVKVASKGGGERQFNGLIDVYRKTLKSDGFVGLYRGFVISCVGIIVYRGCYFGFYDTLKPIVLGNDAGLLLSFALGYVVTISAGLVSYPIDTVRRRMLMRSGEAVKYKGSMDCFMTIMRNEGALSLWRGAIISIFHGLAGAGLLVGFDKLKKVYIGMRTKSAKG